MTLNGTCDPLRDTCSQLWPLSARPPSPYLRPPLFAGSVGGEDKGSNNVEAIDSIANRRVSKPLRVRAKASGSGKSQRVVRMVEEWMKIRWNFKSYRRYHLALWLIDKLMRVSSG